MTPKSQKEKERRNLWTEKQRLEYNIKQRVFQKNKSGLRTRFKNIVNKHGMTIEDYARMLNSQDIKCKICDDSLFIDRHTHIDHDHLTGRIRGILCSKCNKGLGCVRDSLFILNNMIKYIANEGGQS